MDREEKIDAIIEFLDENHIKVIDTTSIGAVIIDAEQCLDKEENKYEYDELLEKGLTDDDIESFKEFLQKNTLMMIKTDEISGVSLENCEYDFYNELIDTDLLEEVEEEGEEQDKFLEKSEELARAIMPYIPKIKEQIETSTSKTAEIEISYTDIRKKLGPKFEKVQSQELYDLIKFVLFHEAIVVEERENRLTMRRATVDDRLPPHLEKYLEIEEI